MKIQSIIISSGEKMKKLRNILNEMINDFDVNISDNAQRFKSAFSDYSKGEFRGERELLIKIIEIGAFNTITNAEEISIAKKVLVERLHDEYFLEEKACSNIIDIYTSFIKKDDKKSKRVNSPTNSNNSNTDTSSMKHMSSFVNSWSFDVPKFFETMKQDLMDMENVTMCSCDGDKYCYILLKHKQGDKPPMTLFSKRIESLSAYIAYSLKEVKNPIILNQKKTDIDGLPTEYYQLQTIDDSYIHDAYLETRGFFYNFRIAVPYDKKNKYREQMDAFIYSIKLN